jgi:hypothetical protein
MQGEAVVSSSNLDTEFMQEEAVILYPFSPWKHRNICRGGCCILPLPGYRNKRRRRLLYPPPTCIRNTCRGRVFFCILLLPEYTGIHAGEVVVSSSTCKQEYMQGKAVGSSPCLDTGITIGGGYCIFSLPEHTNVCKGMMLCMQGDDVVSSPYLDTGMGAKEGSFTPLPPTWIPEYMQGEAVVSFPYLDTGIHAGEGCCILALPGHRK